MKHKIPMLLRTLAVALALPLIFAGCLSIPPSPDTSSLHPANPHAPQASSPALTLFLMADTNLVVMTVSVTNSAESGHEHHAKPKTETPHQHDHN